MSPRRPRKLVWRVGLALMALEAIVAIVLGLFIYVRLAAFHASQTRDELSRSAALLDPRYQPLVASADTDALRATVERDADETNLRITVIKPGGVVIADSHVNPEIMDNHRYREEVAAALRQGSGSTVRFSDSVNSEMTYFARVIGTIEQPLAIVRVAIPLTAAHGQLAEVVRSIAVMLGLSLLVTLAGTWLVSRALGHAVRRLTDGAARFAAGDYEHRILPPPTRELAALADGLNRMADEIGDQLARVRAQRNEQSAILRSMGNGVLAIDRQQRIVNMNRSAARMFDVDEDESRGRLLQEVVRQPALHRFIEESFEREGGDHRAEVTLHGRPSRVIEVRSESLLDADDEPTGLLLVLNDITELRRLESIRSEFAANVSHELRTPITNIKGYVETLHEVGAADEAQFRRFLEIIKANADRLAAIIEDLLALARLESTGVRKALESEPTPAARIVDSVIEQLESVANAKSVRIDAQVEAGLTINAVPQLIEQALANLLSNAIKYSPGGSVVHIVASSIADRPFARFEVIDTGPGIAAEHLPRLFERFYRVDRARSRELGGTGLGLAIVKHIAIAHGGRVEVESTPGKGSVFRFEAPRAN